MRPFSVTMALDRGLFFENSIFGKKPAVSASFAILARMPSAPKKLFLVDAMAHIYRAFYAPMNRMNAPSGIPTKVPFLFANILRRLIKDYQPDYLGIVFDTKGPTFRDKLFEKYKA